MPSNSTRNEPSGATENSAATVSLIIPLYNESESIELLLQRIHEALAYFSHPWELILVDDGSKDDTLTKANAAAGNAGPHVRIIELMRHFGKTDALQAGIDHAGGKILVMLDGDLQDDPADIPPMVAELETRQLDLLAGWRKHRKDPLIMRKIPSRIANWLIRKVTGVTVHDYGCGLKVFRGDVLRRIRLYGEMHRFIPAWMASVTSPARIGEFVVNHHPRELGQSKYGIGRSFRVIIDLLTVLFFLRFHARPGHFFGIIGLASGGLGSLILGYLAWVKFMLGESIGTRPLLLVGIVLIIAAAQFLTTGVLAELLARTYYESSERRTYAISHAEQIGEAQYHRPGGAGESPDV
jgi:glycosyltransferase involved in cell wall biosynthesis